MMELIAEVVIPNYVRKIKVANKRQATYYKQGEKIPEKYTKLLKEKKLFWVHNTKKNAILLSAPDGTPVIKNSKSAGTPRYKIIAGNDLHRLTLRDYERSKILAAIKEQMNPLVDKLEPISKDKYPLRILMEVHTTLIDPDTKRSDWDVDNHGLWYAKAFPDVLSGNKIVEKGKPVRYATKRIIEDDNVNFIIQAPVPKFIPIDNYEDRKLVFKIYSEKK